MNQGIHLDETLGHRPRICFSLSCCFRPLPHIQYDREIQRAFDEMAPVGMAVAVVENGQISLPSGYGRIASDQEKGIDADTVFPLHSMTKSFVSAALAVLVDEGKISWSDPVIQYIPEFATRDPYVTKNLTVCDLLVHNPGLALGAGDLLSWPDQTAPTAETIAALRYLPLDTGFRASTSPK